MIGISPEFEDGTCSVCEKTTKVRVIGDDETHRVAKICNECAQTMNQSVSEFLETHGHSTKTEFGVYKEAQFQFKKGNKKKASDESEEKKDESSSEEG